MAFTAFVLDVRYLNQTSPLKGFGMFPFVLPFQEPRFETVFHVKQLVEKCNTLELVLSH